MIKISLILLLCLAFCSSKAQFKTTPKITTSAALPEDNFTGIVVDNYPNGQPKLWKEMQAGQASGTWIEWFPNGKIRYQAAWKNNKGHGHWLYFHPNGQVKYETVFVEDIPQGISRTYYENGQLETEEIYVNGQLHGRSKTYDRTGFLVENVLYQKGKKIIDQPIPFAQGIISTTEHQEFGLTFSPDGKELYFCRRKAGQKAQKIYYSQWQNNSWTAPVLASFSTHTDEAPHYSQDGKRLYFASYRPLPKHSSGSSMDMNIWYVDKQEDSWGNPIPFSFNQVMQEGEQWPLHYETSPMTDAAGNLYYWSKSPKDNSTDLYKATRNPSNDFSPPQALPAPINSPAYETGLTFSPDGNYVFFGSSRKEGSYGQEDIYYAKWENGQWSTPKNLGSKINSAHNEAGPIFSPDGQYFYFASDRGEEKDADGNRIWSIYYLESSSLLVD